MSTDFPNAYKHTMEMMGKLSKDLSGPMEGFSKLHQEVAKEGALNGKTKELIALGIAITVRCNGCIGFHVHDALKAGASKEEIVETIGVAVLMGGGPSVIYGIEAYEAIEQFEEQGV